LAVSLAFDFDSHFDFDQVSGGGEVGLGRVAGSDGEIRSLDLI